MAAQATSEPTYYFSWIEQSLPYGQCLGMFRAFKLLRCGASHWEDGPLLQRLYGVAFPSKILMKEWSNRQEEAKKRDHRILGQKQGLFMFHPLSPGSAFMLPHGTRVFNRLSNFIREEYRRRGYEEVITPLVYKTKLWDTSGHMENYREDMFMIQSEYTKEVFGLKPMNCPGHCLIFKESKVHSYRDLPVRMADFSALHRNEASGALTGLTRVRRFHQDDAHIFCAPDQVQDEILDSLDFVRHVYHILGFEFKLKLSTRPNKFMGSPDLWHAAESQLVRALDEFGEPWDLNAGDGAFYGPKIDVEVTDALARKHQCATIQLDFQLPDRFELKYDGPDGQEHRPIIIHRAVLGSLERIMAIFIEHTAGRWPLWLSPRQVAVIPLSAKHVDYANRIGKQLRNTNFYTDIFPDNKTLNKRIKMAQMQGYNYVLVVGDKEVEDQTVNVRSRDGTLPKGSVLSFEGFLHHVQEEVERKYT